MSSKLCHCFSWLRSNSRGDEDVPDDIVVLEFLEERDLANGGARHALVLRLEPDLLQRDDLVRADVARLVHDAVRACTPSSERRTTHPKRGDDDNDVDDGGGGGGGRCLCVSTRFLGRPLHAQRTFACSQCEHTGQEESGRGAYAPTFSILA